VTVVSDQITAALPLSQMSVNRVTARPVPDGGMGPSRKTASLACSTLESSTSMPGNCTVGGFVMWKLCATLPNVGNPSEIASGLGGKAIRRNRRFAAHHQQRGRGGVMKQRELFPLVTSDGLGHAPTKFGG
jgi:hypothetical protein